MGKLSDGFGQEASRKVSKAAADAIWAQGNGTDAYCLAGKIVVACGVGWLLLSLIPIACKNPLGDWLWMWIVAAVQLVPGTAFVVLSKKSEKFRRWANKSFEKELKQKKKMEEKAKIGSVTLPFTNGDVLAFKILGIIALILAAVLGIGYVQGWVV